MKTLLSVFLLILLLYPAVLPAQSFTLAGTGIAFNDGDKIYLTYKDGKTLKFDSAVASGHTFLFKGTVKGIGEGMLYKNENPMIINEPTDYARVYIEAGQIRLTTADSLCNAVLSGTVNNEAQSALHAALKPYYNKLAAVDNRFYTIPEERRSDESLDNYLSDIEELRTAMQSVQLPFVRTHPAVYISLLTLKDILRYPASIKNIQPLEEGFAALTSELHETALGKQIAAVIAAFKLTAPGSMAPGFALPDTAGKIIALNSFRGQYVLIDFWASWCVPCRKENPRIAHVFNKHKQAGFVVLGVSIDADRTAWLKAIKADGLNWLQVWDSAPDAEKIKTQYGITTIPANLLLDKEGWIIARNLRGRKLEEKMDELLGAASR